MLAAYFHIVVVDIKLHLTNVGVIGTVHFQIYDDITAGRNIVKHEVGIKMLTVKCDTFLPTYESKSTSQFEHKIFEMRYNGVFQLTLL